MGGVAKGNLLVAGQTVLSRTVALCLRQVAVEQLFLVGESEAYDEFPGSRLADNPVQTGPLGGLRALLLEAQKQERDAVALAVDMPFIEEQLLGRLCRATCSGALAPKQEGLWQPLFARYSPAPALSVAIVSLRAGRRSLQSVFEGLGQRAERLPLSEVEQRSLRDWDSPSDLLTHN